MTEIRIVTIGRDKDPWITAGVEHYCKMLRKYASVELLTLPRAAGASLSPDQIRQREAERIQKVLGRGMIIGLVDSGAAYDSRAFAGKLERLIIDGGNTATFVIGGPHGLDDALLERCHVRLSLSPLTMSHQVVRLVLLEQLFRAFSILRGTDYHK